MLTAVLIFLGTLAAVALGYFGRKWHVEHRTTAEARGDKFCGICHCRLPLTAKRTHEGYWRCGPHKGITR